MRFSVWLSCSILLLAIRCQAQDPPRPFKFTPPDEKLLKEANALDLEFQKKDLIYNDPKIDGYLNLIGSRLLAGATAPDRVTYQFHVLRDPMVNAFALPNGSIYVNAGLVAAMKNEAELAAVMAHEMTHVVNRHTYIFNRDIRRKQVTIDVIALTTAAAGYFPLGAAFGYSIFAAGNLSQVLVISTVYGYNRQLESEADTVGYGRLIHAGYDGGAMSRAFEQLDERLEFEPAEPFWRTHPKLEERIIETRRMAQGDHAANPRAASESDYLDHVAPVVRDNILLDLDSRRYRTAVERAQRLVAWASGDATDRVLLADSWRSLGAKAPKPDEDELSKHGKAAMRKQMLKLTADEEERGLLASPAGKTALAANQAKAETLYREAIAADHRLPDPHRGLGMLDQDQGKSEDAAREYRTYLELASPGAIDRLRIQRRLETLTGAAQTPAEKR